MKHTLTLIAALALLCGSATAQIKKSTKVYICTGKTARAYHTNRNCEGLGNCKGEIKQIKMKEAVKQGRHFCSYCKKNQKAASKTAPKTVTLPQRDAVRGEKAD